MGTPSCGMADRVVGSVTVPFWLYHLTGLVGASYTAAMTLQALWVFEHCQRDGQPIPLAVWWWIAVGPLATALQLALVGW